VLDRHTLCSDEPAVNMRQPHTSIYKPNLTTDEIERVMREDPATQLAALRHDLETAAEPLPEDVVAERLREVTDLEADLHEREVEGLPPAEEDSRS
jgi:hypothetical protein